MPGGWRVGLRRGVEIAGDTFDWWALRVAISLVAVNLAINQLG